MVLRIIALIIILALAGPSGIAQHPLSQTTQVEISLAWVSPFLQSGRELSRAENLRSNELSYSTDDDGTRRPVGNYPSLSGYSFGIGFYQPVRWAKGLMLGAVVRNSQTGTQPTQEGDTEAYYFNFITAGGAVKYYPFPAANLFVRGDVGIAAVFSKNRFLDDNREQQFFHQFGIGSGSSIGVGYAFTPFKDKSNSLELQLTYQQLSTRVEVNGIGDDQWRFSALHVGGGIDF